MKQRSVHDALVDLQQHLFRADSELEYFMDDDRGCDANSDSILAAFQEVRKAKEALEEVRVLLRKW